VKFSNVKRLGIKKTACAVVSHSTHPFGARLCRHARAVKRFIALDCTSISGSQVKKNNLAAAKPTEITTGAETDTPFLKIQASSISLEHGSLIYRHAPAEVDVNTLEFTLNGAPIRVTDVDPNTTLLNFVRARGLTGSKEGCAEGECGACAVAMLHDDESGGSRFEAVNSCLCSLPSVHGREVWTVEGIGTPEALHPAQEALTNGGSQCGYCTPGFVVSMFCAYHDRARDGAIHVEDLCGNLCRCTGYRPIRDAASSLGQPEPSPFTARLERSARKLQTLEYTANTRHFSRPSNLPELFAILERDPSAKLIAGGTDVVVDINLRHARHTHLVSLEALPELRTLNWGDEFLEIGAGLSLSTLEAALGNRVPLLAELFPLYASRLIRNRATLGGNLVTASPIGDSSPVLLALGAQVKLASARGERAVPLNAFFTNFRETALKTGEIVVSILVPRPLASHQRFFKIAKRGRDDISTVAIAIALEVRDDVIQDAKLGLGGVAATPARAPQTEAFLIGKPLEERTMRDAGRILESEFTPLTDHRGSAAYRRAILRNTLERYLTEG
jgi:xanthine dehydrogenase small subunit